jgi:hypothetical protein
VSRVGPLLELPTAETPPWVESRAGGLFFVNAVLVAPIFMAVYPVALRALLRLFFGFEGPSAVLDPVPEVAAYVAPVLGWLALPAAILVVVNLRVIDRRWARTLLWAFLAAHVGMLAYTVARVVA